MKVKVLTKTAQSAIFSEIIEDKNLSKNSSYNPNPRKNLKSDNGQDKITTRSIPDSGFSDGPANFVSKNEAKAPDFPTQKNKDKSGKISIKDHTDVKNILAKNSN